MDAIKPELLTLTFESDCEDVNSYQTITLLLQGEHLNKLRFTPLATTVCLSQPLALPLAATCPLTVSKNQ